MPPRIIEAEARITATDATGEAFASIARKVKGLTQTMRSLGGAAASYTLAPVAAGAAGAGGIRGLEGLIHETVKATSDRAQEQMRDILAGISPTEMADANRLSLELSQRYQAFSQTTVLHALRNMRSIVGTYEEAAKLLDPILNLRLNVLAAHPNRAAELDEDFDKLMKGEEIVGASQDPERFKRNMELTRRAMNVFGDTLRPYDFFEFAQHSRGAGQSMNDQFRLAIGPTLMQHMGGSQAGTAVSSMFQQFVGGHMSLAAANLMEKFGLLDNSKVEFTKAGLIKRVQPGALVESDLFKNNAYEWLQKVFLPKVGGDKSKEQLADINAVLASKATTDQILGILISQAQSIEKDIALEKSVPDADKSRDAINKNVGIAWQGVTEQFQNLLAVAGSPLAEPAAAAMHKIADGIIALENAAAKHPIRAAAGLVAGATGAAAAAGAAGLWGLRSGLGWILGRGGSKAAADLSGEAAIRIMQGAQAAGAPGWLASTVFPTAAIGAGMAAVAGTELSARASGSRTMFGDRGTAGGGIGPLLPWLFGGGPQHFSLGDVHKALGMPAAEVKGSADLNVNVTVAPTEDFVSRIVSALRNGINVFSGTGTAGSTGVSMPEAGPAP
jgi:hypothetical protein